MREMDWGLTPSNKDKSGNLYAAVRLRLPSSYKFPLLSFRWRMTPIHLPHLADFLLPQCKIWWLGKEDFGMGVECGKCLQDLLSSLAHVLIGFNN